MRADPAPRLTVSIVSHGNGAQLGPLLESLCAYEHAAQLQLIVTDNLGDDIPAPDPSPWHSFTLLRNHAPRGFAANHNAASGLARGEYFCLLNPDILFLQPIFDTLMRRVESGQGDIAAPLVIDSQGQLQDSFRSLPTPLELFRRWALGHRPEPLVGSTALIHPDWIAGFFMLLRTSVYAGLRGMDEHYRLYLEDVEFCTRARLHGFSLLVDPSLRIRHDAARASHRQIQYLLWHLTSALRFFSSPVYHQAKRLSLRGGER